MRKSERVGLGSARREIEGGGGQRGYRHIRRRAAENPAAGRVGKGIEPVSIYESITRGAHRLAQRTAAFRKFIAVMYLVPVTARIAAPDTRSVARRQELRPTKP